MLKNKNILIVALIAVVNALGYGIIIPILYSYSQKFGLSDFQNGLLFSVFSICQFVATPVIGRLSDKYGRKPLLVISLVGTLVSFLMMAFARNGWWLFLARALDGITAGNIPVAQAVISDSTEPHERAKGFGIIGASFGFGFVFGPAISALTLGWGANVPFLVAACITLIAVLLTQFILPETNKHKGLVEHKELFNFAHLWHSLMDPQVGVTLFMTFLFSMALSMFIYAFQPFSVKILHLTAQQISSMFIIFGAAGLIAQVFMIPRAIKFFGERKMLTISLLTAIFTFSSMFFVHSYMFFIVVSIVQSLANAFVNPLLQALLSKEVDAQSQGSIMGVSASYMSLGMIIGPIIGGGLATFTIPLPFLGGALTVLLCFILSMRIPKKLPQKVDVF